MREPTSTSRRRQPAPPPARAASARAPRGRRIAAIVGWVARGAAPRGRGGGVVHPPAVRDHLARLGDAARLLGRHDRRRAHVRERGQPPLSHGPRERSRPERVEVPAREARLRSGGRQARGGRRLPLRRRQRHVQREPMSQSQDDATKVALERLGYTVTASAPRLLVVEACRGVPAYGALLVGDEVVAVDGAPVADGNALSRGDRPVRSWRHDPRHGRARRRTTDGRRAHR